MNNNNMALAIRHSILDG